MGTPYPFKVLSCSFMNCIKKVQIGHPSTGYSFPALGHQVMDFQRFAPGWVPIKKQSLFRAAVDAHATAHTLVFVNWLRGLKIDGRELAQINACFAGYAPFFFHAADIA